MEKRPFMIALLPCGLRNAFKAAFYEQFPQYDENADEPDVMIEGNLNYEKVFYSKLDEITDTDTLPDILISADFNSIYHRHFIDTLLNKDYFETLHVPVNEMYGNIAYPQPEGLMTMLPPNLLVIVADKRKFEADKFPTSWEDLLRPELKQQLVLRGDNSFFCNALFFPYIKNYGYESVSQLGRNTRYGLHPSEMVKQINTDKTEGIAAYVMPYSFYLKVRKTEHFQLVWPKEGAIVSPLQMIIKKGTYEKHQAEIDFITSLKMSAAMIDTGFPPTHTAIDNNTPQSLNWLGWEFIYNNNMQEIKEKAQQVFFKTFSPVAPAKQFIYAKE
jgi:ABC-type Fe3+ transport system substrate-binding protein